MRVDFTGLGPEPADGSKPDRARQAGSLGNIAGSSASDKSGVDRARFSFDRTRVESLQMQVLGQPEVRQARVQALQDAIGKGEYAVVPGQVAAAMASELGGARMG